MDNASAHWGNLFVAIILVLAGFLTTSCAGSNYAAKQKEAELEHRRNLDRLMEKYATLTANCIKRDQGVKYIINGDRVSKLHITLRNDTGGTDQLQTVVVPVCLSYDNFKVSSHLYISAQILDGAGYIECGIYNGNTLLSRGRASGFGSIATCSTQLR